MNRVTALTLPVFFRRRRLLDEYSNCRRLDADQTELYRLRQLVGKVDFRLDRYRKAVSTSGRLFRS
jgi:hypothetical protein